MNDRLVEENGLVNNIPANSQEKTLLEMLHETANKLPQDQIMGAVTYLKNLTDISNK